MGYNEFARLFFGHVLAMCHISCATDIVNNAMLMQYMVIAVLSREVSSFRIWFFICLS